MLSLGVAAVMVIVGAVGWTVPASAAQPTVGLGTAASFAVLAGSTVTNTGPSIISGNLGLDPGTAVTGFPPGKVIKGTQHVADAVALQAQADLKTAYNDAAGRTPATTESTLGGKTLAPGVYKATSTLSLTGKVVLNAHGNANAVFIFQVGSSLLTASSSTVSLAGGAQACNVFWQVGISATLDTNTTFVGTIMALTSAALDTGATVAGRVLARNAEVSLDDNLITVPTCATTSTTTTSTAGATTTTSTGSSSTTTPPGVPVSPTGEPWAGWPYWALTGLAGFLGMVFLQRAVRIGRRHS